MEISEQPQEEIVEKIPGRDVYETGSSLVSALLGVVLVFTFLVRLMGVSGPSMIPTLQDGDRLVFGGETVEVLSTPGHTEGSVCFLMPGLMLSGDTLFYRSVGRTDLSGGDSGALTASLRRLCALPEDYRVIPGHGRETTQSAEKAGNPYLAADGERKL